MTSPRSHVAKRYRGADEAPLSNFQCVRKSNDCLSGSCAMLSGNLALAAPVPTCGYSPIPDAVTTAVSVMYTLRAPSLSASEIPLPVARVGVNPTSLNSLDQTVIESVSPVPVNVAESRVCEGLTR